MVNDAMDTGETGEADDVYNQILGEIGMEIDMVDAGGSQIAGKAVVKQQVGPAEESKDDVDDLEARLAALS